MSHASLDATRDAALHAALGEHVLHLADSSRFASAAPFPHVVIENFFALSFVERLVSAFPPFEQGNTVGDGGDRWRQVDLRGDRAARWHTPSSTY